MSLSLTELRDQLSLLLLSQSPHLPTNVTEIKLTDGYRTVELRGADYSEILENFRDRNVDLLRDCRHYQAQIKALEQDIDTATGERNAAQAEVVRLQADLIELGLQLNAVLSR